MRNTSMIDLFGQRSYAQRSDTTNPIKSEHVSKLLGASLVSVGVLLAAKLKTNESKAAENTQTDLNTNYALPAADEVIQGRTDEEIDIDQLLNVSANATAPTLGEPFHQPQPSTFSDTAQDTTQTPSLPNGSITNAGTVTDPSQHVELVPFSGGGFAPVKVKTEKPFISTALSSDQEIKNTDTVTVFIEEQWFQKTDLLSHFQALGIQTSAELPGLIKLSMTHEQYNTALELVEANNSSFLTQATVNDDYIVGTSADNQINGLPGNDILVGLGGADRLNGDEGNDTIIYNTSTSPVHIDLGYNIASGGDAEGDSFSSIENVTGSQFSDKIFGDHFDNILDGNDGDDQLIGREGNDTLFGGSGADLLDGGEGENDLASYFYSTAGVDINLTQDTASGGHADGDELDDIENVNGSLFDDILNGDQLNNRLGGHHGSDQLFGHEGDDVLVGGNEGDLIDGGEGSDTADYTASHEAVHVDLANHVAENGEAQGDQLISIENLAGSAFDDTLAGNEHGNRLSGRDGNDSLFGYESNDTLVGGLGADLLDGGAGDADVADYSQATEGVGVNLVSGGFSGEATGDTFIDIEYVAGSGFDDDISGDDSVNRLTGGNGNDTLFGAGGNDRLIGGLGADHLDGGDGNADAADYSGAQAKIIADLINGGSEGEAQGDTYANIEFIVGSTFNDELFGDEGKNRINGGAGDDILNGREGNDTLIANAGDDVLSGGDGNDVFIFHADEGSNTILDFEAGAGRTDRVWLREHDFNSIDDVLQSLQQTTDGAFLQNGDESLLFANVNVDQLVADDFILA